MGAAARKEDDIVTVLSPNEYKRARKRALDSVGLTYGQLKKQARRGEFESAAAKKVWIAVGDFDR